jgi:formylglycine-generating enzyme required for sulfatase activity
MTATGINRTVMLMNVKLYYALFVAAIAFLGLFPGAVLSENIPITVAGKNLMFAQTEVTIGAFEKFVNATGTVTRAARDGGGLVYASGWEQKPGWTWLTPYGQVAHPDEPAVHVTFDEAEQYCQWVGKRLPT